MSGLLVGTGRASAPQSMALEVTETVIQEAPAVDAQLILTHHPGHLQGR